VEGGWAFGGCGAVRGAARRAQRLRPALAAGAQARGQAPSCRPLTLARAQTTLWRAHGIRTVRRTLAEVSALGTLDASGVLRVGRDTASVVYFRAGYTPNDYPTQAEWDGRSLLERSQAVKCPSIGCALARTTRHPPRLTAPAAGTWRAPRRCSRSWLGRCDTLSPFPPASPA